MDSTADLWAGVSYSIDWGDGSSDSGVCDQSGHGYARHTYAYPSGDPEEGNGGYWISLNLTDKDGGSCTMSGRIIVAQPFIRLNAAGGTFINSKGESVEDDGVYRSFGSQYGELPIPRKKGYSFRGWTWFDPSTGEHGIVSASTIVEERHYAYGLHADWDENVFPNVEDIIETAIDNAGLTDAEGVKAAIGGDFAKYAEFRAWSQGVPGGEEAVVDSSFAAKSYLLGASALMTKEIESEDVRIVSFETGGAQLPATSGEAATLCFTLEVEIDGVDIGGGAVDEDVLKENLKKVLGIEGARTLAPNSFSSDNIDIAFGTPVDGKARIIVSPPPDAGGAFFMRVNVK